jgi:hypothetical protein
MVRSLGLLTCLAACLALAACSSPEPAPKQAAKAAPGGKRHPLAKYLELAGFRTSESGAGKLKIRFTVINHSEADIGDLVLKVRLTTTAAKPEDPPVAEFEAKVPTLGPHETQDVTVSVTTKLRVYELPDWQFLKADFDITSPEP